MPLPPALDSLLQPSSLARTTPGLAVDVAPTPLPHLHWVARSDALATELGLDPTGLTSADTLDLLGGNRLPAHGPTRATVYSGHQFGHWAGRLGDGRALLLGELPTPQGPMEVQLKGAGLTPFSRMGDGRAVLRSSVREFLCSEAMHGLGIPTTRALALVGSPQPVARETVETAAVVTRVAPSFLRFGHMEHFSYSGQHEVLKALADHVIDRYYPQCRDAPQPYAAWLQAVSHATAALLAQWQAVGFCHGVMNTDNMSLLGLTLDYGPFQFMDGFDPHHICNHTDSQGRYAYARQPSVARWNLFCLAQALLPLIGNPDDALAALDDHADVFATQLDLRMAAKLGLPADLATPSAARGDTPHPVRHLSVQALNLLATERVDHTLFWRRLSHWVAAGRPQPLASHPRGQALADLFIDREALERWLLQYSELSTLSEKAPDGILMLNTNPKYVLRNHLAQTAIEQAQAGDFEGVQQLLGVLQSPFDEHPRFDAWADLPPDWAASLSVSCSS
jgi:uncharacterized protein YdiU (UPF0061 family)